MCDRKRSWTSLSTLPTRAVSTASIVITIEPEEECERTPLLAAAAAAAATQWRSSACQTTTNNTKRKSYGGLADDQAVASSSSSSSKLLISGHKYDRQRFNSFGSEYSGNSTSSNTSTYYYEVKPHLCDVRLFAIFFILITGFTIATYLMIVETRPPSNGFILDLVTHDIWSKIPISLTGLLNPTNVLNVLITHTGGESCDSPLKCSRVLDLMQKEHWSAGNQYELPYNFLVADDGQTYEVRGWDYLSGYITSISQNTSIVIGIIGNYTQVAPNIIPLQSVLSLIKESVRRKKLQQNYHIYGLRNLTAHGNDAEALFRSIINWPHFEKLINISSLK